MTKKYSSAFLGVANGPGPDIFFRHGHFVSASLGYNIYFFGDFFWKPFSVVASPSVCRALRRRFERVKDSMETFFKTNLHHTDVWL